MKGKAIGPGLKSPTDSAEEASRTTELSQHASDGRKSEGGQCIAVEVESTSAV
jgi:hypothetical protein